MHFFLGFYRLRYTLNPMSSSFSNNLKTAFAVASVPATRCALSGKSHLQRRGLWAHRARVKDHGRIQGERIVTPKLCNKNNILPGLRKSLTAEVAIE